MLTPINKASISKKDFTDKEVLQQFVKDIFAIGIILDKIETEKRSEQKIGPVDFKTDVYAETSDHRFVIVTRGLTMMTSSLC